MQYLGYTYAKNYLLLIRNSYLTGSLSDNPSTMAKMKTQNKKDNSTWFHSFQFLAKPTTFRQAQLPWSPSLPELHPSRYSLNMQGLC